MANPTTKTYRRPPECPATMAAKECTTSDMGKRHGERQHPQQINWKLPEAHPWPPGDTQ